MRVDEQVVCGTHGRLKTWIGKRIMPIQHIKILVFDEADEMLKVLWFLVLSSAFKCFQGVFVCVVLHLHVWCATLLSIHICIQSALCIQSDTIFTHTHIPLHTQPMHPLHVCHPPFPSQF